MNKKQLYESIMKNVAREVKKALNEADNAYEQTMHTTIDKDCFSHVMYGSAFEDLDEFAWDDEKFNVRKAIREIKQELKKFADNMQTEIGAQLTQLGITIKFNAKSDEIIIDGITMANVWDYVDLLQLMYRYFPGEVYIDDIRCFIPNEIMSYYEDEDDFENDLWNHTHSWCAH